MGGALVIDVIVIFLWKQAVRICQGITSSKWDRKTAKILEVSASPATTPGCPVVKISYRFFIQEQAYECTSAVPFLFVGSAKQYAQALRSRDGVVVRVDPRNPERSLLFHGDQYAEPNQ